MAISSFGASVGSGPVFCVLLDIEDGVIVGQQSRTIDPGPYRLGRRGNLLSSGFDLLANHSDHPVDASAVAVRSRRDLMSVRLGARGAVRAAGVVREPDAVLRALDEKGVIARFGTSLVADLGAGGLHVYTVSDGAVAAERYTSAVNGAEPGSATAAEVADFVRSAIDDASTAPEGLVLIGAGAQHADVREALSVVARAAGVETVTVDDPEAVGATGAALLAADRRAAGVSSALVSGGIGALGGYSVRLTAAVLPLVVLTAVTLAVLATGYATGIVGPAGESSNEETTSSVQVVDVIPSIDVTTAAVSSAALPPRPTPAQVPTSPAGAAHEPVTPTMTTFAPPPAPTTTRPLMPTVPSPAPTKPTTGRPTTILPPVVTATPTGTPTPSGSPSQGGTPTGAPGSDELPSGGGTGGAGSSGGAGTAGPIPTAGAGLVGTGTGSAATATGVAGSGETQGQPAPAGAPRTGLQAPSDEPTVTSPAP